MTQFYPGGDFEIQGADIGYQTADKRLQQSYTPVDSTGAPTDPDDGFVIMADHGSLTGLLDDDHTQYLKKAGDGGAAADVPGHAHAGGAVQSFSGAQVTTTAAVSVLDNTLTVVSFGTERFDTANFHDAGTPTRLTAPVAGYYLLEAHIEYEADATGFRDTRIRLNGATQVARLKAPAATSGATSHTTTALVLLALGDYAEVTVQHTAGATIDIGAADSLQHGAFSMALLGL